MSVRLDEKNKTVCMEEVSHSARTEICVTDANGNGFDNKDEVIVNGKVVGKGEGAIPKSAAHVLGSYEKADEAKFREAAKLLFKAGFDVMQNRNPFASLDKIKEKLKGPSTIEVSLGREKIQEAHYLKQSKALVETGDLDGFKKLEAEFKARQKELPEEWVALKRECSFKHHYNQILAQVHSGEITRSQAIGTLRSVATQLGFPTDTNGYLNLCREINVAASKAQKKI